MDTLKINTPSSNTLSPGMVPLHPSPKEDDIFDACEEVHLVRVGVDDLCGDHEHLKKFKTVEDDKGFWKTTYYQTYGGGPEGGYFSRAYYTKKSKLEYQQGKPQLFEVNRTWGTPFSVKAIEGTLAVLQREGIVFVYVLPF